MKKIFALTAVLVSVTTFAQVDSTDTDVKTILENSSEFSQYYINGDYHNLALCYSADAKIIPPGAPIIAGHGPIEERWTLPDDIAVLHHEAIPDEIKVLGDHAYDYGQYKGVTRRPDGSLIEWGGKYVIVWRKENDDWKIYLDIWNQ